MHKGRLEAFSDAVIAILMTIMVLELRAPEHMDVDALQKELPFFLSAFSVATYGVVSLLAAIAYYILRTGRWAPHWAAT